MNTTCLIRIKAPKTERGNWRVEASRWSRGSRGWGVPKTFAGKTLAEAISAFRNQRGDALRLSRLQGGECS
jgi:hypothetical protein